jgi:putative ABC transport system permease protein
MNTSTARAEGSGLSWKVKFEMFSQDLRHGWRTLYKKPGFTVFILLILSLGIGLNTALFSIVDAAIMKPLPYPRPGSLVWVTEPIPQLDTEIVTGGDFLDWNEQASSFESIGAFSPSQSYNLTFPGRPEHIRVIRVSANFLSVLGVSLAHGRLPTPSEDRLGGNLVSIVSSTLWDHLFGHEAPLGDQVIKLDGKDFTVIGILPESFRFPRYPNIEILIPLALDSGQEHGGEQSTIVDIIGRTKPGVSLTQASVQLETIIARRNPNLLQNSARVEVIPLHEYLVGKIRSALMLLFLAVACLLLIICFNIANLVLARSAVRQREYAIRTALGARRQWLAVQVLTETSLLGLIGGTAGLFVAFAVTRIFTRIVASGILDSYLQEAQPRIDGSALLFMFGLSLATGVLFGLFSAFAASRVDLADALREGGQSASASPRKNRTRKALIISEIALALVLLTAAGLLLRSLHRLMEVNPGFRSRDVLTMTVALPEEDYRNYRDRLLFFNTLSDKLRSLPGVQFVGLTDALPLFGNVTTLFAMTTEGDRSLPPNRRPPINMVAASSDYFRAMGIPILQGRSFEPMDKNDMPPVAIVSAALAEHFWGNQNALGARLKKGPVAPWITVIGVAGDVHQTGLDADSRMTLYVPFSQTDISGPVSIAIRDSVDPDRLANAVRREVEALDARLPIYSVETMETRLSASVLSRRSSTLLVLSFAAFALVLAATGIYGVLSLVVAQRTQEIGIRMALGSSQRRVVLLVVRDGMKLLLVGIVLGTAASVGVLPVLTGFLFNVSPLDTVTYCSVLTTLSLSALLACLVPAWRSARIDPIVALRYE